MEQMVHSVYDDDDDVLQEDNAIPAYILPLRGDENSFQYKSDTCEYIIEAATGREKKKSARYTVGEISIKKYLRVFRAMCRKWKRKNKRKLRKRI